MMNAKLILLFLSCLLINTCTTSNIKNCSPENKDSALPDLRSDVIFPDSVFFEKTSSGSGMDGVWAGASGEKNAWSSGFKKTKKASIPKGNPVIVSAGSSDANIGGVAYYIPDTMRVGCSYRLSLRISKKLSAAISIGLPVGSITSPIRVGNSMSAIIIDETPEQNSFTIRELNSAVQSIENDSSYTTWEWSVMPTKSGVQRLKLLIVIKNGDLTKDIPVYNREILVFSSPAYSIQKFIGQYWQWAISAIALPFIFWFYGRKKKNKEEES